MLPGHWLAFAMVLTFALIFALFFWQARRQGLFSDDEDMKYKVLEEEDEQEFEDAV